MRKNNIVLILFSTLIWACQLNKPVAEVEKVKINTEAEVQTSDSKIPSVIVDETFDRNTESMPYSIEEYVVEGNILTLTLGYSGGCSDHHFQLFSRAEYAESFPEQLTLFLVHNTDDLCKKHKRKSYSFDLTPTQLKGSQKIIININGLESGIEYIY